MSKNLSPGQENVFKQNKTRLFSVIVRNIPKTKENKWLSIKATGKVYEGNAKIIYR